MTMQLCDLITYRNTKYEILAYENKWPIDISKYNIKPNIQATLSCNLKGYENGYRIEDEKYLFWDYLRFRAKDGVFPPINGVAAELEVRNVNFLGKNNEKIYFRNYNNIMKVPYTGGIIIGDNYIRNLGKNYGFQYPHMYESVFEFNFECGELQQIRDFSKDMMMIRKRIKGNSIIEDFSRRFLFNKYCSHAYKDKWRVYKYFRKII